MMGYSNNLNPIDYLTMSNNKSSSGETWYLMRGLQVLIYWTPFFGLLHSYPFDIVAYNGSIVPSFVILTNPSTIILGSSASQYTPNKTITSPGRPSKTNFSSLPPCIPQWATRMIEYVGPDVGDISIGIQTHIEKQHASVSLMTLVIETCDPYSYVDAQGQPKWE